MMEWQRWLIALLALTVAFAVIKTPTRILEKMSRVLGVLVFLVFLIGAGVAIWEYELEKEPSQYGASNPKVSKCGIDGWNAYEHQRENLRRNWKVDENSNVRFSITQPKFHYNAKLDACLMQYRWSTGGGAFTFGGDIVQNVYTNEVLANSPGTSYDDKDYLKRSNELMEAREGGKK